MFKVNPRVQGVSPELFALYQQVCPSTIGHMMDFGFLKGLTPIYRPIRFVGNAVTVRIPHMDSTALHKVMDFVEPGDVIVVDMSGDTERASWGEMVAYAAKVKRVAGAVIDGCVTDYPALQEIKVPVFSLGVSPLTTRILGIEGEINGIVSVRGVSVKPGDLVVADDDGVFVIDPAVAEHYGTIAITKHNAEIERKRKLDAGLSLASLSGADKYFK